MRDQLQILQRAVKDFQPFIQSALDVCIKQKLWSANDFYDVVSHLARIQGYESSIPSDITFINEHASSHWKEKAVLRELDGYLKILGGV